MIDYWMILSGSLVLIYVIIFVWKTKTGSPSIMSQDKQLQKLAKYIQPEMKVLDFGGGTGEAMIAMIKAGAKKAEAWEIEPLVWWQGQRKIKQAGLQNKARLRFGDMWQVNLGRYDLIYVYQLTRFAPRLVTKIKKEAKKKTIVIANTYPLDGLKLIKKDGKLMIYQI